MGELIKVEKILGKPYLMVGSADTDIILNGKGNVKVRFGNAFLDLISNGKISKTDGNDKSINIVQNKSDIGTADGWYFVESEDAIYFQINRVLYPVLSKRDDIENSEDYLAINYNQDLTLEQIRTAQRNLKVIINNQDNTATLPIDFVYFNSDDKVHYYNNNGTLVELYLNLSSGGVVKDKVTINLENNLHGSGDLNVIGPNGLQVKNQQDYLNIVVNNNEIVLDTNTSGIKFNSKEGITYINGKYISIGYPPTYNYNFEVDGNIYVKDKAVLNSGIISDNFIEGMAGYRLANINSEWTLEVDNLIVRNSAKGPFGDSSSKEKDFITRGLNTNYFFEPQGIVSSISEIVPDEEESGESGESGEVIPIKYEISINGIYNIKIGDYLYFEKHSYGYNVEIPENSEEGIDVSTLIPTTKIISKGRIKIEKLEWIYDEGTFTISGCNIVATIDGNVLDRDLEEYLDKTTDEERKRELEKLPEVGDILYLKTQDSLYLHSIRETNPKTGECLDKSYLGINDEVAPLSPRLRLGCLEGIRDPIYFDTLLGSDIYGVYSEKVYCRYIRLKGDCEINGMLKLSAPSTKEINWSILGMDTDFRVWIPNKEGTNNVFNIPSTFNRRITWGDNEISYLSDLVPLQQNILSLRADVDTLMNSSGETPETIMAKINSQDEIIFTKHTAHLAGAGDTSVSDIRYKNNIEAITGVLSLVLNSPGFKYNWMDEKDISIGTSAQYWNKYYPELTRELHNSILTFSYERYPIILQEAFKEEHRLREIEKEAFEERIKYLEQELNNLKNLWQETKKLK
jgi:hypothetical protein